MIKLALTSDTHYGHSKNTHRIHEKFLEALAADIKTNDVKALIHAGDWTSYKQDQFKRTLAMFRKYIPANIPIVAVRGNHDLWQGGNRKKFGYIHHHGQMMQQHEEWFKANNIHHLEAGPMQLGDVIIYGFDGWYRVAEPTTNDEIYMGWNDVEGCPIMPYLSNRAHKKLDEILAQDLSGYRASVLVTHHPSFTDDPGYEDLCANLKFFDPIVEKFDAYAVGHSHQFINQRFGKCLVLNSGSDYDKPKHLIFEV